LVQHGFSVAIAASITALGLSSNLWRFAWAPFTDLTLSLHKWWLIGTGFSSASLVLLCLIPLNIHASGFLTAIVFLSQIAATFVVAPVGGFMAKTITENKKGRAGGWYQAGNLGGVGLGGGAGIWLSTHFSYQTAGIVLALASLACGAALYFVPQVYAEKGTLQDRFRIMMVDLKELFRSRVALFSTVIILTPIGIGAATYVWSSLGKDWQVTDDTVALVTGVLSGGVSAVGCLFGGWVADKSGRWWSFFGAGIIMALVTLIMALAQFNHFTYVCGILFYAFSVGWANAAFSAVVLLAIGKELASTKYALLSSISNLAPVYMTAFDGWMHDAYGIRGMLMAETGLGLGFSVLFLLILSKLKLNRQLPQISSGG